VVELEIGVLPLPIICCDDDDTYSINNNNTNNSRSPLSSPYYHVNINIVTHCVFHVDGKPVEFVKSYSHLGHILSDCMDDAEDICHRWGDFIGQVNNVLCYFITLNSAIKYRLFLSYCTSFYGCELCCLPNIRI